MYFPISLKELKTHFPKTKRRMNETRENMNRIYVFLKWNRLFHSSKLTNKTGALFLHARYTHILEKRLNMAYISLIKLIHFSFPVTFLFIWNHRNCFEKLWKWFLSWCIALTCCNCHSHGTAWDKYGNYNRIISWEEQSIGFIERFDLNSLKMFFSRVKWGNIRFFF